MPKRIGKAATAPKITKVTIKSDNTYNRYGLKLMRPGFNTGGNTNFWMRNFSKTKY